MRKTIQIRVPAGVKERLQELADKYSINPSALVRKTLQDKLEELERFYGVKKDKENGPTSKRPRRA